MNDEQRAIAEKVLAQTERQPESLAMSTWFDPINYARRNWKTGEEVEGCGTTRCIAGWAVHFASNPGEDEYDARKRIAREADLEYSSHMSVGAHLLGLDEDQAATLFLNLGEQKAVDFLRALIDQS